MKTSTILLYLSVAIASSVIVYKISNYKKENIEKNRKLSLAKARARAKRKVIKSLIASGLPLDDINKEIIKISDNKVKFKSIVNLGENRKLSVQDLLFLDNLKDCKNYAGNSTSINDLNSKSKKTIKNISVEKCLFTEKLENNKVVKCMFNKKELPTITLFYKNKLSGKSSNLNMDFDMKLPKIQFNNLASNNIDLNLDLDMPSFKIREDKDPVEQIIIKACK